MLLRGIQVRNKKLRLMIVERWFPKFETREGDRERYLRNRRHGRTFSSSDVPSIY